MVFERQGKSRTRVGVSWRWATFDCGVLVMEAPSGAFSDLAALLFTGVCRPGVFGLGSLVLATMVCTGECRLVESDGVVGFGARRRPGATNADA